MTLRPYQHRALKNLYRLATDIHGLRRLLHQLTEHTLRGMDVTLLPKFGGPPPRDSLGIYSWDEKSFLVHDLDDGWIVVDRFKDFLYGEKEIK